MYWTKAFIPTLKQDPQEAESVSHKLMLRAALVRMLMAGVYSYLPLGFKVLNNIENIIRQEMNAKGASELLLPSWQPLDLWVRSGRDKDIGEVMIRFQDRKKRNVCLGPTHEEVITDLAASYLSSYKQLPFILYQIQTKFRDEIRPRFGVVRACEFIMKDAYSFDADEDGLKASYDKMLEAYLRIFKRCGLNVLVVEADAGVMGGKVSHEFMVESQSGEDKVLKCASCGVVRPGNMENISCPKCHKNLQQVNTVEVGHIFQLGTKYSASLGANFLDAQGKQKPVIMGCYGIGVSRLIAAIIEQNNDKDGIIWPAEVAPYDVMVLPLDVKDVNIMGKAESLYKKFSSSGISVLLDDRDERAGVKFKDADLLGIPIHVIVGQEFSKNGKLELKFRSTQQRTVGTEEELMSKIKEYKIG